MEKYTQLGSIYNGPFSQIVKARNNATKEIVCIKQKTFQNPKDQESFQTTILLWKSLNHPNIVKYIDSFISNNIFFIVMEYVEGQNLKQFIIEQKKANEPIKEPLINQIFYELILCMKYLRDNRCIHRNICPSNIIFAKSGHIKLIDFGSSRMVFTDSRSKMTFDRGDLFYRSPEMMKRQEYFYSTDIWSLGCVLYELIALEHPFKGVSPVKLVQADFPPPVELSSNYSPKLRKTISYMMEPDQYLRITIESLAMDPALKVADEKKTPHDWFLLGSNYEKGQGVEVDKKKALEYYKLSATEKHPQGLVAYGRALEYGFDGEKNINEAMKCYLEAANLGNTHGMNDYARGLQAGYLGSPNPEEACRWLMKSAEEGSTIGMNNYGRCLEEGVGCEKNLPEAQFQFKSSAKKGNKRGMYHYARALEMGFNGIVDLPKALKYYQRAVDCGSADASKEVKRLQAKGVQQPKKTNK